jgi:hypothetical protein
MDVGGGVYLDDLTFNAPPHVASGDVIHHFDPNASNAEADYTFMKDNPSLDVYVIFTSESGCATYTAASHGYFNRVLSMMGNLSGDVMVYSHIADGVYSEILFSPTAAGSDAVSESTVELKYITSRILQRFVTARVGFSCADSRIEDVLDVLAAFPNSPWSITCGVSNVVVSMRSDVAVKYRIMYWCPQGAASVRAIGMGLPAVRSMTNELRLRLHTYQRLIRGKVMENDKCVECSVAHAIHTTLAMHTGESAGRRASSRIARTARLVL